MVVGSGGPCSTPTPHTRRLSHSVARRSKRLSRVGPKRVICLGSFLSFVVRRADGEGGRTFRPISGTTQLNVHIDQGGDSPIGMLCWDVFWIAGPGRGDDTNRSSFQPCFYGRVHSGTERLVHGEMISAIHQ